MPDLIKGISAYDIAFQKALFSIILRVLPRWQAPDRGSNAEDEIRAVFGLDNSPGDAKFLTKHLTSVLMLNYSAFIPTEDSPAPLCCPGVPKSEFEFLTSNSPDTIPTTTLVPLKKAIIKFSMSVLTAEEQFWPLFVGSQENINEVASAAEDAFRKLDVDYEKPDIVEGLFGLFLGVEDAPPVNPRFRARILQLFCKSSRAANTLPQMVQIIKRGIMSENAREILATVEFVNWVAKIAKRDTIVPVASDLVKSLHGWITESGWPVARISNVQERNLRGFAYVAIGSLSNRAPEILKSDLDIISFLFSSLQGEHPDMRNSVHEALSSLIPALQSLDENSILKLKVLLLDQIKLGAEYSSCQYLALRFCIAALPFSDPTARYICILGLDPANRSDIIAEAKKGLHPYWFQKIHKPEFKFGKEEFSGSEYAFPDFKDFLETLATMWSATTTDKAIDLDVTSVPSATFISSLQFARQIFVMKAFESNRQISIIDDGWEHKLNEALIFDDGARKCFSDLIALWYAREPALLKFMEVAFLGFATQNPGMQSAGEMWLEFLTMGPKELVSFWAGKLTAVESFSASPSSETRMLAGHALGLLSTSSDLDNATIRELVEKFAASIDDTAVSSCCLCCFVMPLNI